jgi:Holliday junction resolvasome RuvABC DNA-binding subunit
VKYSKPDSQRNISSLTNSSTIDENVIKTMEGMGYKREYIQKTLSNNDFNYATTTFFLLSNNINDME